MGCLGTGAIPPVMAPDQDVSCLPGSVGRVFQYPSFRLREARGFLVGGVTLGSGSVP